MSEEEESAGASSTAVDAGPLTELIGFHLRLATLALRRSFFQHVDGGSIRPGLASLLQLAANNRGVSQTELATGLGIDKASLVPLISDAESAGWISRRQAAQDKRRYEVTLTAEGQEMAAKLARQTMEHEEKFRELFSEKELERFIEYLQRIYAQ